MIILRRIGPLFCSLKRAHASMNMPACTLFNEQKKGTNLLGIRSVLGKQNVQVKKVYCLAPNEAFVILLHQFTQFVIIVTLFHLTLSLFCGNILPKLVNSYFANTLSLLVYPIILRGESRSNKKLFCSTSFAKN